MKINANTSQNINKSLKSNSTGESDLTKGLGGASSKKSDDINASSKVSLSEKAQMMNRAKEIATKTDDINMEKVKRLQSLIDKGEYKVNAEAIADKLVDEHLMV